MRSYQEVRPTTCFDWNIQRPPARRYITRYIRGSSRLSSKSPPELRWTDGRVISISFRYDRQALNRVQDCDRSQIVYSILTWFIYISLTFMTDLSVFSGQNRLADMQTNRRAALPLSVKFCYFSTIMISTIFISNISCDILVGRKRKNIFFGMKFWKFLRPFLMMDN